MKKGMFAILTVGTMLATLLFSALSANAILSREQTAKPEPVNPVEGYYNVLIYGRVKIEPLGLGMRVLRAQVEFLPVEGDLGWGAVGIADPLGYYLEPVHAEEGGTLYSMRAWAIGCTEDRKEDRVLYPGDRIRVDFTLKLKIIVPVAQETMTPYQNVIQQILGSSSSSPTNN